MNKTIVQKVRSIGLMMVLAVTVSSCATAPTSPPAYPPREIVTPLPTVPAAPIVRSDICHIVAPGETLWRISKMYDVSIQDIMKENRLWTKNLKMGQRLFVPQAAPIKPVIPLYRSVKWEYIIIHHSATDIGNALYFNKGHIKRGFWRGLGYHFVIDNGSLGKEDGQIEVSPRWLKQQDGAHCKASRMNYRGIGICLVGNFSEEDVSKEQMDSLVYLVSLLKKQYKIPDRNIMGHQDVRGANTECPGKYFPWRGFWSRLDSRR